MYINMSKMITARCVALKTIFLIPESPSWLLEEIRCLQCMLYGSKYQFVGHLFLNIYCKVYRLHFAF